MPRLPPPPRQLDIDRCIISPRVGAFKQLFGPGGGNLKKNFQKIQMPGGVARGNVEASI